MARRRPKKKGETSRPFFLTLVEVREDTFRIAGIAPEACTRAFAGRHSEGSRVRACTHVRTRVATRKTRRVPPFTSVHAHTYARDISMYQDRAELSRGRARAGRIPVISMSPLFAGRDD